MGRGLEGGATGQRGYWDTVSPEVETLEEPSQQEEAEDALANEKPVEGVTDKKKEIWANFAMPPMRRAAALRIDWSFAAVVEERQM